MTASCPEGMYPMESEYVTDCETFAALREHAEQASDSLNFPIGWTLYDESTEDWGAFGDEERRSFELVFLMPRKYGKTWSIRTAVFDRPEVEAWLSTWLRGQVDRWYGFGTVTS